MRVVGEIPHEKFKITVFSGNNKYQLKIEIDEYEQVFKIPTDQLQSWEDIKPLVTHDFLVKCLHRFVAMRTEWTDTINNNTKL